jgi:hypothetical protein
VIVSEDDWRSSSVMRVAPPIRPRKLAKVPFVELAERRLQGVVSSGSDIERVYVSSIASRTHEFSCSTNNNRPCGGAGGSLCNHLRLLVDEAVQQYGADRVARYLGVTLPDGSEDVLGALHPKPNPSPAAPVFSRFLHHLAHLEIADSTEPLPELHWFPAGGSS